MLLISAAPNAGDNAWVLVSAALVLMMCTQYHKPPFTSLKNNNVPVPMVS